jgi:putative membrane protein
LIHLAYGLLLAYPVRDLYCRIAGLKGFWSYLTPLNLIMATSILYELIEWGAAEAFGGELGMAYLGTQGDVWDAHKDMALASLGGFIAMAITLFIHSRIQKDFREQWTLSLTVKNKEY